MSSTLRLAGFFFASALLVGIGCLGGTTLQQAEAPSSVLECFKVATDGGPLVLPVEIQGKCYPFLLATGSSMTIYGPSLRPLLGNAIVSKHKRMHGRDTTLSICWPPAAKLGHIDLPKNSPVVCMDLGKIGEVTGEEISGCLGMDFLGKHVFRIDFDRGEVTFLTSAGPDSGQRLPVVFNHQLPHVMVEVAGLHRPESFAVNTSTAGNSSGDLRKKVFAALAKQGMLTPAGQTLTETPFGSDTDQRGRVESISLAGFRHEKLLFCESGENVLKLNYLSRFVVTFDFPNKAIYLKKGRQYERADVCDLSGLRILRHSGQTLVDHVEEGSLAERAGVKPQDVLLKIDDMNVNEMSLYSIRRSLCVEGKRCRFVIRRGEKELETEFILHDR